MDGYGTRLIPHGTFESVHFIINLFILSCDQHYVQISGRGNMTKINVIPGNDGGELGGVVFGNGNQFEQWTEFLLTDEYCIRACFNRPDAWRYCNHIYDLMACRWNIPANYAPGFDTCTGDDVPLPMGEYKQRDGKIHTWHQGEKPTPGPGKPGKIKKCQKIAPPGASYKIHSLKIADSMTKQPETQPPLVQEVPSVSKPAINSTSASVIETAPGNHS
ncbi:hypothetical protein CROQUDRAFT_74138 [Cronartium quercuum f. sp. fusiforme G11]|uniref:Uncharacterized protein n=1 Tax=Cronartium quercuum f. sp. fusiforme G11 TaxID=708437 RepID=A0A9P6NU28_9BASI|nr:hypothetical protein CROQUDRAFT_74138 [Cronartium quercuum f. sp. fusiforme G11]